LLEQLVEELSAVAVVVRLKDGETERLPASQSACVPGFPDGILRTFPVQPHVGLAGKHGNVIALHLAARGLMEVPQEVGVGHAAPDEQTGSAQESSPHPLRLPSPVAHVEVVPLGEDDDAVLLPGGQ
jgi:hypothetical protein